MTVHYQLPIRVSRHTFGPEGVMLTLRSVIGGVEGEVLRCLEGVCEG